MDSTPSTACPLPDGNPPGENPTRLKAAAAVFLLNALLSMEFPHLEMNWSAWLRVSPDGLCLLLGMCVLSRPGQGFRPAVCASAAAGVTFLILFQAADRCVPMVFNRPFNLFQDVQRLPDLIFLLWRTRPPEWVLMGLIGAVVGTTVLAWGVCRALRALHLGLAGGAPAHPGIRLPVAALSVAALAAAAAGQPPGFFGKAVFPRVIEEARFIIQLNDVRNHHRSRVEQAMARALETGGDLARLGRAPVFLIVVESYGRSAFSDRRHAETVLPALQEAEIELQSAGFAMASAYLTSPTFGGGSWLSHATLASGVRTDSQIAHDLLLASPLVPLADYFNRAGYRTVRAMPGTLWPWPEGGFYRFRQLLIAPDFDYRGPTFGFAPMPDQFVLDWVARTVVRGAADPLFVEVILTGSHAAFDIQAPYLDDWERIGDGSVYGTLAPITFPVTWSGMSEASPAYSAAIAHEILLLKGFIRRFLDGRELVIVVGDHQPCVELIGSDQPWSVPVHVISGNPEFIREFMRRGYTPGLVPMQPLPHPGLETLFWDLLEGFSNGPSGPGKLADGRPL
jgi:hypothetical protein